MIPSTFIPGCITRARLILLPRGYPEKPSSRVSPEIYCKELAHRTVEVGEPPGARGESAGWTPRGAGGLAPVPRRAGSRPRKSQCSRHKIVFHLSFRTCITAPNGEHHSGGTAILAGACSGRSQRLFHRFSAFGLTSSVVSLLLSLISYVLYPRTIY